MPSAPDEEDPLSDLRQSFEGDVAPSPTPTERGSGSGRSASGPPPLPTKRSTSERKREGVVSAPPVAHVPRSLEDPFQEPSEPRLPHGLPEEKLEFFLDRKSTRLNSSHSSISYAVFCLKKKK